MVQQTYGAMLEALASSEARSLALADKIASMEMRAGDVNVDMPPRAKSFRIEYDDVTGQPERLIPEYDTQH